MSDAPLTQASHDLLSRIGEDGAALSGYFHDLVAIALPAIESAARAAEAERLRALYMATVAGEYCNIDVFHDHVHQGCNARCWCSWADPEHCPLDAAGAPPMSETPLTEASEKLLADRAILGRFPDDVNGIPGRGNLQWLRQHLRAIEAAARAEAADEVAELRRLLGASWDCCAGDIRAYGGRELYERVRAALAAQPQEDA